MIDFSKPLEDMLFFRSPFDFVLVKFLDLLGDPPLFFVVDDLASPEGELILNKHPDGPCQDLGLQSFPFFGDVFHGGPLPVDPEALLTNDGSLIEVRGHKMGRHPHDFDPLIIGLDIGMGPGEGGEERGMDVDDAAFLSKAKIGG